MNYTYVGITLVKRDGSVLVQHRDDKPGIPSPGKWGMCGGKMEPIDKDPQRAACRELREETGYVQDPDTLVLVGEDNFETRGNCITRKFYRADYDETQVIGCFEGAEIRFVSAQELAELDFCDYSHFELLNSESRSYLERARLEPVSNMDHRRRV